MSAGAFSRSKYESDAGGIFNIRVQPETLAATFDGDANAAPAGAVDQPVSAFARSRPSGIGMHARRVSVVFTATPPATYKAYQILQIPVLTKTLYDAILPGSVGTYQGVATQVVGKLPEKSR